MTDKTPTKPEPVDIKELVALLGGAASNLSFACDTLVDVDALFQAVVAATPSHHLAHRLAALGSDVCAGRRDTFADMRDEFNLHAERLAHSLGSGGNTQ